MIVLTASAYSILPSIAGGLGFSFTLNHSIFLSNIQFEHSQLQRYEPIPTKKYQIFPAIV